jgi:hypothetical protein
MNNKKKKMMLKYRLELEDRARDLSTNIFEAKIEAFILKVLILSKTIKARNPRCKMSDMGTLSCMILAYNQRLRDVHDSISANSAELKSLQEILRATQYEKKNLVINSPQP